MPDTNHIGERLRRFVLEKFPQARKRGLTPQAHLLESGLLDSLGVLEVVTFMEEQFHVMVSDDELVPENFQTLERMTAFIERKLERRENSAL